MSKLSGAGLHVPWRPNNPLVGGSCTGEAAVAARAPRRPRLRAVWLAAVWSLVLTGCASQRAMQQQEAAAPGRGPGAVAASPAPMLRAVGAAAPAGSTCRAHEPSPQELAKQHGEIEPLRVPALYSELFYGEHRDSLAALDAGGIGFRQYKQFDDRDSGLSGYVLLDDASGHALVLFKGMDRPFAERDGWGGVLTDLGGVLAAKFGTGNEQIRRGDDAYTEALCDEAIKSIELVGYSMGSQIANYLAVKYGAYAVVFGDMGLDSTLLERHAHGDVQAAREQAREHIVSLSLGGDLVVKVFGVGRVVGTVVKLPGSLAGVLHQPEVYAHAANAALREREAAHDEAASTAMRAHGGTPRQYADDAHGSTDDSMGLAVDAHKSPARH